MGELNKYISNYIKEIEEKRKIVSSDTYLTWLDKFIEENNTFCDDSWLYNQEEISKESYNNVILLSHFFSYVQELANKQNILTTSEEGDDETFYLKLKNKYYSISTIYGQGAFTNISKIDKIDGLEIVKIDEDVSEQEIKERELIQYIIINKDYIGKIDAAKFGVHIGHACTICAIKEGNYEKFKKWYKDGQLQKKIILTAKQSKLEKLEEQFYAVRDLGFTEVENGTLLAVSLGVMTRKEAKPYIKGLQLWKD